MRVAHTLVQRMNEYLETCSLKDLCEISSFAFGVLDNDVSELQRSLADEEMAKYEDCFEKWGAEAEVGV